MLSTTPLRRAYKNSFTLNENPLIACLDNVLSPDECNAIIRIASNKMTRAKVSEVDGGKISEGRTGSNCWLPHDCDPVVTRVAQRIADVVGIPLQHAESLQVIHYGPDQQYKAHYDAYDLNTDKGRRCCLHGGQRMVTALVYLCDVEQGGATRFPLLDTEVPAKQGRMTIFHNCIPGTTDPHKQTLHAGTPVIAGQKWAFNVWFRDLPMNQKLSFTNPSPLCNRKDWFQVNRAGNLFASALASVARELEEHIPLPYFTYWDEYGGNLLDTSGIPAGAALRRLINSKVLSSLSNKKLLAQAIRKYRLQHTAPQTCFSREEALAEKNVPLWFIKIPTSTGGKDMKVIRHGELATTDLPGRAVLQAGVVDLCLIDGRKFTTRIYLLLWNGGAWLFEDGFNVVHGVPFDPGSSDYGVHIDHRGYEKADSPVSMHKFSSYEHSSKYFPALRQLVTDLKPLFGECLEAADRQHYVLLGIDVLLQTSGRVQLIEINTIPNFRHTPEINNEINIPFFTSSIRTMYGLDDRRLTRII